MNEHDVLIAGTRDRGAFLRKVLFSFQGSLERSRGKSFNEETTGTQMGDCINAWRKNFVR